MWDGLVPLAAARTLHHMAHAAMAFGQGAGGPTILDLHSGALSYGKGFVDIYKFAGEKLAQAIADTDWEVYR